MNKMLVFFTVIMSPVVHAIDLDAGVGLHAGNEEELYYSSIPYAIARQGHANFNEDVIKGFFETTTYIFSVSDEQTLAKIDKNSRSVVDSWFVEGLGYHLYLNAEYIAADDEFPNRARDESRRRLNPDVIVEDREVAYSFIEAANNNVGCFQLTPLRYGDIESDGQPELVLFMGYDFIVFSPEEGEVIFSSHFWQSDELTGEEKQRWFGELSNSNAPQFVASSGTDVLIDAIFPAWHSLTKIYIGEFDGVEGFDILLWRKVYDANRNSELPGFHKIADRLVHYTKQDGIYQLTDSTSAMVSSWLAEEDMTWSDGFPSASECDGEEGELIPEMHDPMLNDPEVLQ
ncbi:hypothetical protein [Saccharospirillum alexandrii]|uniref:hypothetical protein n=1 Tax=Saccharospirillum alexandrii TaxID=2448477 RepID=UPI00373554F6